MDVFKPDQISAIFEVKPGRYYRAIWFAGGNETGDLFAAVFKNDEGAWQTTYRFRWYADDRVGDSQDKKSVYHVHPRGERATADAPPATLVDAMDLIAEMFRIQFGGEVHKLLVRSDDPEVVGEALSREHFAHFVGVVRSGP